jgi:hypothetical protein
MSITSRSPDVLVQFMLSPQRRSPLAVDEIRVPLFADAERKTAGFTILLDVSGVVPLRPGASCTARGWFLNPADAKLVFPDQARFWSFELEGRIDRWLANAEAAAAE